MDRYLALVIILFACSFQEVVITHQERKIKALNQHLVNKDTSLFCRNFPTSAEKVVDSSTTPNHHHVNVVSEDSNGDHFSGYRPTTPGYSPGVGHPKVGEENKDVKAKVGVQCRPDVDYSFAEWCKTDYQPTERGHSPRAGHAAHQNKNNGDVGRVKNQLAT